MFLAHKGTFVFDTAVYDFVTCRRIRRRKNNYDVSKQNRHQRAGIADGKELGFRSSETAALPTPCWIPMSSRLQTLDCSSSKR